MVTKTKTNWLLVWTGLFVWMYPLIAFIHAIMSLFYKPSSSSMPAWFFAANLAFVWTYLAWQARGKDKPISSEVARPSRRWSKRAYTIAVMLVVLTIGGIAKGIFGHPSWTFIVLSAIAMPASGFASNFLLERSNLLPVAQLKQGVQ